MTVQTVATALIMGSVIRVSTCAPHETIYDLMKAPNATGSSSFPKEIFDRLNSEDCLQRKQGYDQDRGGGYTIEYYEGKLF